MFRVLRAIAARAAFGAGCVIAAAPATGAAEQGLTGSMRTAFVDYAVRKCMSMAHEKAGVPASLAPRFCSCVAQGLADRTSKDELLSLANVGVNTVIAKLQPKADAASQPCRYLVRKE
jgi:hypothetical protein